MEKIRLTDDELLYLSDLVKAKKVIGISIPGNVYDASTIQRIKTKAESGLIEKGYLTLDFDGNLSPKPEVGQLVKVSGETWRLLQFSSMKLGVESTLYHLFSQRNQILMIRENGEWIFDETDLSGTYERIGLMLPSVQKPWGAKCEVFISSAEYERLKSGPDKAYADELAQKYAWDDEHKEFCAEAGRILQNVNQAFVYVNTDFNNSRVDQHLSVVAADKLLRLSPEVQGSLDYVRILSMDPEDLAGEIENLYGSALDK